jgi:hypothetical protein
MKLTKSQLNTAGFLGRMILVQANDEPTVRRLFTCTCECSPGKVFTTESAIKAMMFVKKHVGHKTRVEHEKCVDDPAAYEEQKTEADLARWSETGVSIPY